MDTAVLAVRLLLATVFVAAGVGKLLDPRGSREALTAFGMPGRLAGPGGFLLPVVELGAAGALILSSSARWGAVAAMCLLAAFSVGIANALARGQRPDCHCFGQLRSAPAGRGTLARNAGLAALSIFVAAEGPGPALDAWISARSAAELAAVGLGIAVSGLVISTVELWRENRQLRAGAPAVEGPPPLEAGEPAPAFSLPDTQGNVWTLESMLEFGMPALVVFVDPTCGPCETLLPDLARWETTLSERLTIGVISRGGSIENREMAERNGIGRLLVQTDYEVSRDYRWPATPTAFAVATDGAIVAAPAAGQLAIEALVRLILHRGEGRMRAEAGFGPAGSELRSA